MIMIRMEDAVRQLVEAMIPRFSGNLGLEMALDLSWRRYRNDDSDKSLRKEVRLLFMRECNYTKVFARVNDFGKNRPQPMDVWKLIGDHDSEWMSGVEHLFRTMEMEARDWDAKESPECNAKDLSEHFGFSIFTKPSFREVVGYELMPNQERYGGEYSVVLGDSLTRMQAAQMMKEDRK